MKINVKHVWNWEDRGKKEKRNGKIIMGDEMRMEAQHQMDIAGVRHMISLVYTM